MIIRAKAPLRIGMAGGGTDVSPYSDIYGGAILNATVSMYAYATIEPLYNGKIIFDAVDINCYAEFDSATELPIHSELSLFCGIYNRIVQLYGLPPLSFRLTTFVDAPKGSGMGTSSTITVAMLGAFVEWLSLPLGEYDIAHLAYQIERIDLNMAGGKQDQYAATFGGFNFMEFYDKDKVIVNPLRIKARYVHELEFNLLLYYTGTSRLSATIIEKQADNFSHKAEKPLEAAHKLKEQAVMMKEALLRGKLDAIGEILDFGWYHKKQMAAGISNPEIDTIYETAKRAGATGGKISGAGGGGFMMFYVPGTARYRVIQALQAFKGELHPFTFTHIGLMSWKI
ncbi:MAG: dehydrogenase [Chitinophagales bacterium]|nr:dehydrogenase [Chitinophagales bacterium]